MEGAGIILESKNSECFRLRAVWWPRMFRLIETLALGLILAVCSPSLGFGTTLVTDPNTATSNFPSDPKGAVDTARQRVASGDVNGAVNQLAKYVALHPREIEPARLLGDLYYRQFKLPAAETTFRRILAQFPADSETHNRLGSVYASENRLSDAVSEFDKSLPNTSAVSDLVAVHRRLGDFDRFERQVAMSAVEHRWDAGAQETLGAVYYENHKYGQAIDAFRNALQIAPNSCQALNGMGLVYLDQHDYAGANGFFERCRTVNPRNYSAAINLAVSHIETQQYDAARRLLEFANGVAPEQPEALVNFGYIEDTHNNWKGAIAYYLKALAVFPFSRDAYVDLGFDYKTHKLYELAEAAFIKGLTVSPKDARLHYLLGETYREQQKTALAVEQFKAAAQADEPDVSSAAKRRIATLLQGGMH